MSSTNADRRLAHCLLVVAQLCFSGVHIVAAAVDDDPLTFALLRELLAVVCMSVYAFAPHRSGGAAEAKRKWPSIGDGAAFLICGYCSFFNVVGSLFALKYLPPTRFSLFQPLQPVIASVFNARQEPLGKSSRLCGIVLAVLGSALVQLQREDSSTVKSSGGDATLGTVIAVTQCTAMATLVTVQKPLLQLDGYDPATLTLVYYSIGALLTALIFVAQPPLDVTSPD